MGNKNQFSSKKKLQNLEEDILKDFLKKNKYEYVYDIEKKQSSQVVLAFQIKKKCYHAIKIYIKSDLASLEKFGKQIKIFKQFKNEKYILQLIKSFKDDSNGLVALAMEFCDGNLTDVLSQNDLDILQIQAMTYQILQGLLKIYKQGNIHGNIKPSNILYSKFKNQFLIADLGLSKNDEELNIQQSVNNIYQTYDYNMPIKEVAGSEESNSIKVSLQIYLVNIRNIINLTQQKGDVFSLGLLLIEVFLKRPLTQQEQIDLNVKNIFSVLPTLKNSRHIKFIQKIISPMVDPCRQTKIEPTLLLQNLKEFYINEECLKQIKLLQNHRKFHTNYIDDILKGIHYEILSINLVWNDFVSDGPKQIALNLEKCHNISQLTLNLSYNSINEEGAKYICTGISKCQNITSLNLNLFKNKICAKAAKHIGTILEKCQQITQLEINLGLNKICADGAQSILIYLERCRNISTLNLNFNDNNLNKEGSIIIGKSFQRLQNIVFLSLNLSNNNIKAEGAKKILNSLQKCQNLEILNLQLSNNSIQEDGEETILETNTNVETKLKNLNIDFSNNEIGIRMANNIGINLQMYQNLSYLSLNLEQNQLNEESVKNISNGIAKCQKITNLNLSLTQNSLLADGARIIGESVEKLHKISSLNLNLFKIDVIEEGTRYIGNSLKKCKNISYLNLDFAQTEMDLEGLKNIGKNLQNCQKIYFLKMNLKECFYFQKQSNLKQHLKKMKRLVEMQIDHIQ
ncbi:kinase domain protein (macronuclear) [Tetrahymena thermophila SB210]|uniref:Kinase domain protein n=1 Tax=Tetrahymena thermophila (strain SB210) TaxID=312017 RepID=Q24GD5_TETTS|nr:kinase domain protein [Tetrahymena thermophila SB210]EAS06795.3 kinase domain protein [Tetrahymena thermophila SB210]|eukprot:XP_001027037.3 kinase domain protein [Tetrahymena thermophila SB210]